MTLINAHGYRLWDPQRHIGIFSIPADAAVANPEYSRLGLEPTAERCTAEPPGLSQLVHRVMAFPRRGYRGGCESFGSHRLHALTLRATDWE
jgi:hypothetical protein